MASSLLDVCRFNPTLGGTTDWTYSSAVTGYQSPTAAGVVNSSVYSYRAESADLTQWEVGTGAYNTGTGVQARTTVLFNSSGTGTASGQSGAGTKISFTAVPQVAIVALAEDLTVTSPVTKSNQQAGTSNLLAVTPLHQQDHDSSIKAWVKFTGSTGAILDSYNVASFVRNSAGSYTVTWTVSFATANYVCGYAAIAAGSGNLMQIVTQNAANMTFTTFNPALTVADPTAGMISCMGRQ